MEMPVLSHERERQLAMAWRDERDSQALDELIRSYLRLVVSQASRFRHYGLTMSDLMQEGVIGLMQAAERFEPERGFRFSTYAGWWVRSSMQEFILRNWSIVRLGSTAAQKSLFFNLRRLRARVGNPVDGPMDDRTRRQIAEILSVKVEDVENMERRLGVGDQSLHTLLGGDRGGDYESRLVDERPDPSQVIQQEMDGRKWRVLLRQSIAGLNEREQTIIRERRLSEQGCTLEELGMRLGISKERVRQIEQGALNKIRGEMTTRMGEDACALMVRG
ncbi:MAG: RNA polymerase factor sigma-32 [Geminicoccaceae bacterium]|nr:RNA polymerase factor sigma-32 [Geminicoccaceae bacterium]MCB9945500.1 RNA polymerase factor sigma-32 [Geminicoccaceae bacterium]